MSRSETFGKREKEKKRLQKQKDKEQRKEERKSTASKSFEDMIAYVDENGNLSSTPPDISRRRAVNENDIDLSSKNKGGSTTLEPRQGVVKFFEKDKGYGFIKDTKTQEEFFFHYSAASFNVSQSDAVSFDIEQGPKGMNAVRILKR